MAQWREHSPSFAVAQAGPNVTFELSLLLVLVLALRVFSQGFQFSSLCKKPTFKVPIRPGDSG